ncbi:MAG: DEAD/DEAH box helicase family protein [Bacteroidetes bacterium]|nr:DEAD/DEAH box helicase family protein [Bacteroidota bacterium]
MNEAQTEYELIDPALKKAGWGIVEGSRVRKQFPISQGRLLGQGGRRSQPLKADYVLQYKNRYLAVIEAKARDIYYTDGVGQAKDYAERLNIRYTYSTNGIQIYCIDMHEATEGDVAVYPSPDELWEMCFPHPIEEESKKIFDWKQKLFSVPFEDRGGTWQPRYYQDNAITKTIEAIADGKTRMLLTLATGTGKTAIAFQIAWKLYHSRWNLLGDGQRLPRILFLADRNILADQAFNAFSAFEEDALVRIRPKEIKKKGHVPKNASIFFTIFQTFMSGANDSPYFGEYPEDFFDFIIIDECHRGGSKDESSWRAIMDYFSPAVQLGLTATPKRDINGDTYAYFGDPVYIYSLKEGINDGFLSPFKVKEISTTGDTYTFTTDDEVLSGEPEEGREYTIEEQNRIIEIKEIEKYRVKLFMEMMNQNQKTLVFCATQIHAAAIRDLINQKALSRNPNYCHRVTADDGKLGEQHLRDFQDNEKNIPTVLTTSQKLSTGVDAPEIRNIVLLRSVNSMIEFKQIVGRGTRLYDGKDYFTIYDFVNAHHHFSDEEWDGPPLPPEEPEPRPEPQPCPHCGERPCKCLKEPPPPCIVCGNSPCVCDNPPRRMIRIKLSDQKYRELDSMVKTSFWSADGTPISSSEFIENLFGDIPSLFKNEEELRKIWILPDTRKKLLEELSEKGYTQEQLEDLKKLVHGEDSDLFDVLAYVAYHKDLVPRLKRAEQAKIHLNSYNKAQQGFLNFVLKQYVDAGVSELDDAKLSDLLVLKYKALADAKKELGSIPTIRDTFIGFQEYLYEARAM